MLRTDRRPLRGWGPAGFVAVVGIGSAAFDTTAGEPVIGLGIGVVLVALAWLLSPAMLPGSVPARVARARSTADGRPVVYWRPGCVYCLRLRFRLGRAAFGLHWVDIWRDPDGAATVRAVTGGDETVPTVVLGELAEVNPPPERVRDLVVR